jgi:CheY-like chemotaxis protein
MPPLQILIAEDEGIIATDLGRRCARLGHAVIANVRSGPEAVAAAIAGRPDLLIINLQLVGPLTGREAAAQICAERPIPVIFLSGRQATETDAPGEFPCPEFYLAKPFNDGTLAVIIREALASSSSN